MSRIRWLIPNRAIYFHPTEKPTIELIQEDNQTFHELLDAGQAPMYFVVDISDLVIVPGNLWEKGKEMTSFLHPNLQQFIIIGGNRFVRFFASIFLKNAKKSVMYANSYDHALALLAQSDPTIDISSVLQ